MNKSLTLKSFLFLMGFFLVCVGVYSVLIDQLEQQHQLEQLAKRLFSAFRQVKRQKDKVLLEPAHAGFLTTQDFKVWEKASLFSIGSQFRVLRDHERITYTITGIEPDGVDFQMDGKVGYHVKGANGTVKIAWKAAPVARPVA